MIDDQEYTVPDRWSTPGPDAPAEIHAIVSWTREALASPEHSIATGIPAYTLCPIESAGKHSSIYQLKSDIAEYCVKSYLKEWQFGASREWVGLRILNEFGVQGAPRAYALSSSSEVKFLVMEWISGSSLGECHLSRPQIGALADITKAVHSISPAEVGDSLWACFWDPERRLSDFPRQIELLKDNPAEQAVEVASLAKDWLKGADPQILVELEEPVFSRGDHNLANCLWDGDKLWLVDLEHIGWHDPVIDLALLTEHVQARRTPHDEWLWFIEQFALTKRQRKRLVAAQRQISLSWLIGVCIDPRRVFSLPEAERLDILLDRVRFVCNQVS